jgi:hypothetical protein
VLQTQPLAFADAQRSCQAGGGQLASLASQAEQAEVEAWALAQGYLLPGFHLSYWLGLVTATDKTWPVFSWLDGSALSYVNWGRWGAAHRVHRSCSVQQCLLNPLISKLPGPRATPGASPRTSSTAS